MNQRVNEALAFIDGVRTELYQVLDSMSQEQLDFKGNPEVWTPGEVFHHLYVVEKGLPKLYAMLLQKAESEGLTPGGPGPEVIASLDQYNLDVVTSRHKAPERVLPASGVSKEDLKSLLEGSRKAMHEVLSGVGEYDLTGLKWPHPLLGDIDFYQWIIFVGKHEKRHMSQLREIADMPGYPS